MEEGEPTSVQKWGETQPGGWWEESLWTSSVVKGFRSFLRWEVTLLKVEMTEGPRSAHT